MIATKAIAAIAMTGLGSLAAGTGAYFQANPHLSTREVQNVQPPSPPPVAVNRAPATVVQPPIAEALTIDPVVITAPERRPPKALAKPTRPVTGPCSDWQAMTTGPADRKVRLLCPH
jgi:hypothetical protein